MLTVDAVIVGGGPGGLAAAEIVAQSGLTVTVLEQNTEIGSPARTSGGSFIKELQSLGIPERLYHPIKRGTFLSPNNSVTFEYADPAACVMDVRGVLQFLAEKAVEAGANIRVSTTAREPILENGYAVGVIAKDSRGEKLVIQCLIVIDATGYRASMSKRAGVHPGFRRFGVGAEYDLYAPSYDHDVAVLIVGSQVAPAGYAWAFPWGNNRVRVGVGIIHTDSTADPSQYVQKLVHQSSTFRLSLDDAQPIEYHFGLIPADGLCETFVGNGIMAVGDAAGQPSALAGEGIRWAIEAGKMAGKVAIEAISKGDCSREFLSKYEKRWKAKHGTNLWIAHQINKEIAGWEDEQWDKGIELLKLLTPDQFAEAMRANLTGSWALQVMSKHPGLLRKGAGKLTEGLLGRILSTRS